MAFSRVIPSKYHYGPRAKWAAKRMCAVHRKSCRLWELVGRLGEKRRIALLPAGAFRQAEPLPH